MFLLLSTQKIHYKTHKFLVYIEEILLNKSSGKFLLYIFEEVYGKFKGKCISNRYIMDTY